MSPEIVKFWRFARRRNRLFSILFQWYLARFLYRFNLDVTFQSVLFVVSVVTAQRSPGSVLSATDLAGVSSLQDFRALRSQSGISSQNELSTITISDAVNKVIGGIETKLSAQESLDRSAFNAGNVWKSKCPSKIVSNVPCQ